MFLFSMKEALDYISLWRMQISPKILLWYTWWRKLFILEYKLKLKASYETTNLAHCIGLVSGRSLCLASLVNTLRWCLPSLFHPFQRYTSNVGDCGDLYMKPFWELAFRGAFPEQQPIFLLWTSYNLLETSACSTCLSLLPNTL